MLAYIYGTCLERPCSNDLSHVICCEIILMLLGTIYAIKALNSSEVLQQTRFRTDTCN